MRKITVLMLALALVIGALAAPAAAGKKKKKKKKVPVTVVEGTIAVGNPADYSVEGGITRNEFVATCSLPLSNGLDGFVFEVPEVHAKNLSGAQIRGGDATGMYDFDLYFYSSSCALVGEANTSDADEFGIIPPSAAFISVGLYTGAEASFEVELAGYTPPKF